MKKWLQNYWRWIALVIGLLALSLAISFLPLADRVKSFVDWVRDLGFAGVLIFIGIYGASAVFLFPAVLLTIAAGLIYGIAGGTAVALAGAMLGAGLAFLVARYLLRSRIKKLAQRNKKFGLIDDAIGKQGWKIVGLLRLSPLIPFNTSNYFCGLTSIGFWPYLLASIVGMFPGTLLHAYLGAIGKAGLSGGKEGRSPLEWTFLGIGLLATIAVTVFVSRVANKALQKEGAAK